MSIEADTNGQEAQCPTLRMRHLRQIDQISQIEDSTFPIEWTLSQEEVDRRDEKLCSYTTQIGAGLFELIVEAQDLDLSDREYTLKFKFQLHDKREYTQHINSHL